MKKEKEKLGNLRRKWRGGVPETEEKEKRKKMKWRVDWLIAFIKKAKKSEVKGKMLALTSKRIRNLWKDAKGDGWLRKKKGGRVALEQHQTVDRGRRGREE